MSVPTSKIEALFEASAAIADMAARAAYLDRACPDPDLRREVESLLAAHQAPDSVLEARTVRGEPPPLIEGVGTRVGRYKLLQQIGEGGCGIVYMAEQEEPVRRRVALKVIKLGMDTKTVVARFEAERQALAVMDHPNIAKVLDAGATASGRPYFVMELVRGIPITRFCHDSKLDTRQRLELFIQVCQAIQHAHQKGIIHRDIKPSNILVTLHDGQPIPKVIDFGIAKATEGRLTDRTLFTAFEQFIGTPAYMSPEQAELSGLDIDTRSDIYSLGVLLYELLTGKTPFDASALLNSGIDAMRKTIREVEPQRPSTRLSTMNREALTTAATEQGTDALKLVHLVRGDLDWIVMKCLEKDRSRRYETATGLAADLNRHLNNEPVIARPPTAAYKFQKAWRRNKVLYSSAIAVSAALTLGLVVSLWMTMRARQAERRQSELRATADKALANETAQRLYADQLALETRRNAYAADINLTANALEAGNLGRAVALLDGLVPPAGQPDLRGWEWRHLRERCQGDSLTTLCTLTNGSVRALRASADGRWLAILGIYEIQLWDMAKRTLAERFDTPWMARAIDFSPSSKWLAFEWRNPSTQNRSGIRVWDLHARQVTTEFSTDSSWIVGLGFDRNEETLTTVDWSGRVHAWRLADGIEISLTWKPGTFDKQFSGPATTVRTDLDLVVKGGYNEHRVLDLKVGAELWSRSITNTTGWNTITDVSPDGRWMATVGNLGREPITLWETRTGRIVTKLAGHRGFCFDLLFGPANQWLAAASIDHSIILWDLRDPARIPPPRHLRGHRSEVWALALLADGRTLVSGSKDGEVCLWDTTAEARPATKRSLALPERDETGRLQPAPDRHSLWWLNPAKRELRRWDGRELSAPRILTEFDSRPRHIVWSSDGKRFATAGTNGLVQIWNADPPVLQNTVRTPTVSVPRPLQFDSSGQRLAIWTGAEIWIWHVNSNRRLGAYPVPEKQMIHGLRMASPQLLTSDLERLVIADEEASGGPRGERFALLHLNSGQTEILGHRFGVSNCTFSPDDSLLAMPSTGGFVHVWEVKRGRQTVTLKGFLNGATVAAFSPDGRRLAVGTGGDGLIWLWDVATWRDLLTIATGNEFVMDLGFTLDGGAIWTRSLGTSDDLLQLWRAPSLQELAALEERRSQH